MTPTDMVNNNLEPANEELGSVAAANQRTSMSSSTSESANQRSSMCSDTSDKTNQRSSVCSNTSSRPPSLELGMQLKSAFIYALYFNFTAFACVGLKHSSN